MVKWLNRLKKNQQSYVIYYQFRVCLLEKILTK